MSVVFRNAALMPLFFLSGFLVGQLHQEESTSAGVHVDSEALAFMESDAKTLCINRVQRTVRGSTNNKLDVVGDLDEQSESDALRDNTIALSLGLNLE